VIPAHILAALGGFAGAVAIASWTARQPRAQSTDMHTATLPVPPHTTKCPKKNKDGFIIRGKSALPRAKGTVADLLADVESGKFGKGVDWEIVDRVVKTRSSHFLKN
jgi:hypothetical protein